MHARFQLITLVLLISSICSAQNNQFKKQGNEITIQNAATTLKIEFCTASLFRVRASWNKQFEADEPWMVVKYNWPPVIIQGIQKPDYCLLQTDQLAVKIYTAASRIDVLDKKGNLLSSETVQAGGIAKSGDTVRCTKKLDAGEHFFGFGERMDFMDRRNKNLKLNVGRGKGMPHIIGAYNILEANYSPVPFFMSTKGYGIFFHTAYPTEWDMGSARNDAYSFAATGGELDYYFMYGPAFPSILDQYTTLTGKSPMMSLYAYGLQMGTYSGGTWGYEQFSSDRYVIELARKLRAMGIPVDILWLDSTWRIFGEVGGKGATSFEWRETFRDPQGMFDSLYAMHYKMVGLHLRPRFDNGKKLRLLDTARRLGYTYPEDSKPGEFVNFFDSASVDFWWKHGVMKVASEGAKFLKTDEGSAFGGLANESDKTGPSGKEITRLHNIFPLAYAKAPYEKFQQYNGERGLNQTREGYAGIQRYPYIFAGDWPSEWQYFAPVIKAGLNIGLSGVGNWAHCMGGFEHPADPELYMRWVQFGMFSPVALVFGMDHPGYKEPWNYGKEALDNFKKYDSLRYRLLPYIYTYAYQMHKTGMPLMRALVLNYQDDENVYDIGDEYLFGNDLLVCPVTTKGAQTRTVYLPEGKWFDYWTGNFYNGKQYIHIVTPPDVLPLFAKAGAIIPMQPAMSYVGEKPAGIITLDIFPGLNTGFDWYEDDGTTLAYQQNKFSITKISLESSLDSWNGAIHLKIAKPAGAFAPPVHGWEIKAHLRSKPAQVRENGKILPETSAGSGTGWYYNVIDNILYVRTGSDNRDATDLSITF